jgi:hypothetical protein
MWKPHFCREMVQTSPFLVQTATALGALYRVMTTTIQNDELQQVPSDRKTRKFQPMAAFSLAMLLIAGAGGALLVSVGPSTAAELAQQPDTQIAVFMVPLTILVLGVLFEVARFALRDAIPAQQPAPRRLDRHWQLNRDGH